MKNFFKSLDAKKKYVVFELFFVYFVLGIVCIILGSVMPELRDSNHLDYSQGGALLSIQSAGYLLIGLFTGRAAVKAGLKRAFMGIYAMLPIGLILLLTGGGMPLLSAGMFLIGLAKGSITDYNNRIISDYGKGQAAPLNLLHACFALGACIAPLIALGLKSRAANGWWLALAVTTVLVLAALLTGLFMKIEENRDEDRTSDASSGPAGSPEAGKGGPEKTSSMGKPGLGFFREPIYISTLLIALFYQAVEASFMGWLTSFYLETGVMQESSAQLVTSVLWISLLVGRLSCSAIALRFKPWQMLNVMCAGMALFMLLMILGSSFPVLLLATIGMGLCMAGMYGTGVSNAGTLFSEYSEAMGFYVTLNGVGAVAGPALVGIFANSADLRKGFFVLLAACVVLVASSLFNTSLFLFHPSGKR